MSFTNSTHIYAPLCLRAKKFQENSAYTPDIALNCDDGIDLVWLDKSQDDESLLLTKKIMFLSYIFNEKDAFGSQEEKPIAIHTTTNDVFTPIVDVVNDKLSLVVWPENTGNNIELLMCQVSSGKPGKIESFAEKGINRDPHFAKDNSGNLWLAWQRCYKGKEEIVLRMLNESGWSKEIILNNEGTVALRPAITKSAEGGVWVAWEELHDGLFNIMACRVQVPEKRGNLIQISAQGGEDLNPSIVEDSQGRLWAAFEREQTWGTTGRHELNYKTTIELHCYDPTKDRIRVMADPDDIGGRRTVATMPIIINPGSRRLPALPKLEIANDGKMYCFYRLIRDCRPSYPDKSSYMWPDWGWDVWMMVHNGESWSDPLCFIGDPGPSDSNIATVSSSRMLYVAYAGSPYPETRKPIVESSVFLSVMPIEESCKKVSFPTVYYSLDQEPVANVISFARENPVKDIKGKQLNCYWGDLHRHTYLSKCMYENDGNLWAHYRWARWIAELDFYATTDHVEHISTAEDEFSTAFFEMMNEKGKFITLFGIEIVYYDSQEHACQICIDKTLAGQIHKLARIVPEDGQEYTTLYDKYTKSKLNGKVISIKHNHRDVTPKSKPRIIGGEYEPVVEVTQVRGDWPLFTAYALSGGKKLGFVGGSDHSLTFPIELTDGSFNGCNYMFCWTGIWAENLSRESVFEAIKKGRTFATNAKKMSGLVRIGDNIMGDEVDVDGDFEVIVEMEATTELQKIELYRDGECIREAAVSGQKNNYAVKENGLDKGKHYYYAKVTQLPQKNEPYPGIMWLSPIFVDVRGA